jgi:hypothetical protein
LPPRFAMSGSETFSASERHTRPLLWKSPTNSFFLVSTLMTGNPACKKRRLTFLIYRNCRSWSGCGGPVKLLRLPMRPTSSFFNKRRTVVLPTRNWRLASFLAICRKLFRIHCCWLIGSPAMSSETISCKQVSTPGFFFQPFCAQHQATADGQRVALQDQQLFPVGRTELYLHLSR